ncbi:hypothetical protein L0F51_00135 [Afifella sp. H1R]|uniref:hypothetical protein n=1 Tax=Afifella sp. H1R TaxID=2908841 RepID=UPI001F3136AB|nr:hypothetical protein [Afifella sp. H1R]MCF1502174.1 hypothetical protein [Afifella sp. H1R]
MSDERIILTLDIATNTGFATGQPGALPRSGVVRLKKRDDEPMRAPRNLACWLRDQFVLSLPHMVIYEAPMATGAMLEAGNASRTADLTWMLVGAVEAVCGAYGIPSKTVNVQTVRKHFTGRARWGDRQKAKRAVIERCHLLGLIPGDCRDDNRGDACAIFDWASATLFRAPLPSFAMFQEPAA